MHEVSLLEKNVSGLSHSRMQDIHLEHSKHCLYSWNYHQFLNIDANFQSYCSYVTEVFLSKGLMLKEKEKHLEKN